MEFCLAISATSNLLEMYGTEVWMSHVGITENIIREINKLKVMSNMSIMTAELFAIVEVLAYANTIDCKNKVIMSNSKASSNI